MIIRPFVWSHDYGSIALEIDDRSGSRKRLTATVWVMNEPFGRTPHDEGLTQGSQRQIAVQPVADKPTHDAAGEEVDAYGWMEPPSTGWTPLPVKSWSIMFGAIGQACSLSVIR